MLNLKELSVLYMTIFIFIFSLLTFRVNENRYLRIE